MKGLQSVCEDLQTASSRIERIVYRWIELWAMQLNGALLLDFPRGIAYTGCAVGPRLLIQADETCEQLRACVGGGLAELRHPSRLPY